jgi:hypothetical protein
VAQGVDPEFKPQYHKKEKKFPSRLGKSTDTENRLMVARD